MTNSSNVPNVAADATPLVAATPVVTADNTPNAVLTPWDSAVVDLLETVAENTEGLHEGVTAQVTEPTAVTPGSEAIPVNTSTVVENTLIERTVIAEQNQPQPEVVAATPAEADQQHSLAGLQAGHSTSDEAQTTPVATSENTTAAANTRSNTTHQRAPIRLANGQFASRAQLSTRFGMLQASMASHQGDLTGYALGGGLWSSAKETMGLMHHAQGLFNRVRGERSHTNTTPNQTRNRTRRSNRQAESHTESRTDNRAASTTQAATPSRGNTTDSNVVQDENTTSATPVSHSTPTSHRATNDQHPNQPDIARTAPGAQPSREAPTPSLGQQQQADVRQQVQQDQQQQLLSDQLARQTTALLTEERNTQQLLQAISNNLAQKASCCCGSDGLDIGLDELDRRQQSDDQDNNRRRSNRRSRWLSKLSQLAKWGGPVAGVMTAATTYEALKDREELSMPQKVVQIGAATTGTVGGAAAGAMAGASLGSVIPLLGTAVGGLIGGIIGGVAGNWLGDIAGQTASDYLAEKPTTMAVSELSNPKTADAQNINVDHSELQFTNTDKLVVNTTTTSHQGRISSTTIAEPATAAVTIQSRAIDPAPIKIDSNSRTSTVEQPLSSPLTATTTPQTITLDEQKLGQALAKSLQQLPANQQVQPTAMSTPAPDTFSSIPIEFDDVVLTLMSHDRI
ncbi:hypothetical protein [Spartinivicinus ruber]|uniref:hypothetical protein n=1 Tax=Spartinivicinus ruber TaxID=2683272 RepID=UPI0013CF5879|nr:hypothetical protein [Spartinivicinus ruber]